MSIPLRLLFLCCLVAATGCGDSRVDILGTEKKKYSQFDEELVIRDFFQDRRGGFFVDVGASQPVFARMLGVSAALVRSWEGGQRKPAPMARRLLDLIRADPSKWRTMIDAA